MVLNQCKILFHFYYPQKINEVMNSFMNYENIIKQQKLFTLEDFPSVRKALMDYNEENCDFNVCNVLSWGLFYKLEYSYFNGTIICYNPHSDFLLFPTFNGLLAEDIYELFLECRKRHPNVQITAISQNNLKKLPDIEKYFTVHNDKDWNDYIYITQDLVNLPGKKLAKKKNLISQFHRLYPDNQTREITSSDSNEILDFCIKWRSFQTNSDEYMTAEAEAIKIIFNNWDMFPCEGLKLYANGILCSFTVWSPQTTDMATVHFEKSNPNYKGAAQVINNQIAKEILKKNFKYINREQDMGDVGIRQAKHSYQPYRMLPFYELKLKKV